MGEVITLSVRLQNAGPADATNVAVREQMSAGLSFQDAIADAGSSYDAGTVTWAVPFLASGESIHLLVKAVATAVGTHENAARVTASDQPDPDSTPDNDDADEDDEARVRVSAYFRPPVGRKTVGAENLPDLEWRLVWINAANDAAIDVQVSDPVPEGTTYVAGSLACTVLGSSTTALCSYQVDENRVFWQGTSAPTSARQPRLRPRTSW